MNRNSPPGALTIEDLNFDPPALPRARLQELAKSLYGITGSFKPLEGERDQNCRITTKAGARYVLKVSGVREKPATVDFQLNALMHIADQDPELPVPRVVRGRNGELAFRITTSDGEHAVRMLSWLPGILYQDGPPPSDRGLFRLGVFLARLNRALSGFEHPAASFFMPWDSTNGLMFRPQLLDLLADEIRSLAEPSLDRIRQTVYPALSSLPRQVIHHDGHGANLLRASADSEAVSGMIDFGDMIHGPLICDLAVSVADFIEDAASPLAVAAPMCRGFCSVTRLSKQELDLLLDLVIARKILVLQLFEFRRRHMENPPRFVIDDQPGIIASLKMLLTLDGESFGLGLHEACQ